MTFLAQPAATWRPPSVPPVRPPVPSLAENRPAPPVGGELLILAFGWGTLAAYPTAKAQFFASDAGRALCLHNVWSQH